MLEQDWRLAIVVFLAMGAALLVLYALRRGGVAGGALAATCSLWRSIT